MPIYPQYRKIADKNFYHLVSETEWFEIQRLGKKHIQHHFHAVNFLDRVFLSDLLSLDHGRYEVSNEQEFARIKDMVTPAT